MSPKEILTVRGRTQDLFLEHWGPTHWIFFEIFQKLHGCVHPTNTLCDCSEELGLCRALLVLAEFLLAFLVPFLVLEHSEHNSSSAQKCPKL